MPDSVSQISSSTNEWPCINKEEKKEKRGGKWEFGLKSIAMDEHLELGDAWMSQVKRLPRPTLILMRNSNFTNNTKDILQKCTNKNENKEMRRKIFLPAAFPGKELSWLLFATRPWRKQKRPLSFPLSKWRKSSERKKYELPA